MASSMEFWGVEVKAGVPLKVTPTENAMIHVSQAALGELKKDKGKEAVPLFIKCGDQKLVIGTLSSENFPQVPFDLVFEKEFELSHNWKGGSVYFCGYQVPIPEEGDDYPDSEFSDEEEIPLTKTENVKAAPKGDNAAAKSQAAKPESSTKQVKVIEPSKPEEGDSSEDDSDEDSEDDSDEDDESESDLMVSEGNDDDSDEEETPKKAEVVKKRPNDSALKTPVSKKAKTAIPQKTEGKKGAHTATPHPSKQAGKTPANGANPKGQTPKSGGEFSCGSCGKSFNKEVGLQSHKKAKHGGN